MLILLNCYEIKNILMFEFLFCEICFTYIISFTRIKYIYIYIYLYINLPATY
jgi:hypothetical protein